MSLDTLFHLFYPVSSSVHSKIFTHSPTIICGYKFPCSIIQRMILKIITKESMDNPDISIIALRYNFFKALLYAEVSEND